MKKTTRNSGSNRGKLHKLFFVGPKDNVGMENLADRLIELKLVQEIFLDEYSNGYIAKVRFLADNEPKMPDVYIARHISKDFGRVMRAWPCR
jgi:hypothetical protein